MRCHAELVHHGTMLVSPNVSRKPQISASRPCISGPEICLLVSIFPRAPRPVPSIPLWNMTQVYLPIPDPVSISSLSMSSCCPLSVSLSLFAQVLPIERGGGLDQKLLLNFSRKLAAGGWCHVFPEGKTVQVRYMPHARLMRSRA